MGTMVCGGYIGGPALQNITEMKASLSNLPVRTAGEGGRRSSALGSERTRVTDDVFQQTTTGCESWRRMTERAGEKESTAVYLLNYALS